ncbi:MAG: tryptophan synthase subunit alpha [Oscillospiraceae bacterium]|nr:tryptophan synthase subunit alpha [Oscillospiraceae bacterium]
MKSVEEKFFDYEAHKQGAVIVEIPLLQPIPKTQLETADLLVRAGIDVIQIAIPVRFPWMYGSRILQIQKLAAHSDICYRQSFDVLEALVNKYTDTEFMPVGFYGGLQRMGQSNYVSQCASLGIKLADIPDYPLVHDNDPRGLAGELREHGIDYVTIISSEMAAQTEGSYGYAQLEKLISMSHGFCFLLAAAGGKTGEKRSFDYDALARTKEKIVEIQKKVGRRCPIVAVCGISEPEQVRILVKELGLHVMFGSALFTRIMNGDSNDKIYGFLSEMKNAAS